MDRDASEGGKLSVREFLREYPRKWREERAFRLQAMSAVLLVLAAAARGDWDVLLIVVAVAPPVLAVSYMAWYLVERWKTRKHAGGGGR